MLVAAVLALTLGAFEPDPLLAGKPYALRGHTDGVSAIAFSSDGRTVASGARDKQIKLWSLESGELLRSIPGGEEQINALAFSPDGRWLASGEAALRVRLIDVATGEVTKIIAHPGIASELAWSPDGRSLAVASVQGVGIIYDVAAGERRSEFDGRGVRWSGDGKTLVVTREKGEVLWLDAKTLKPRKKVSFERESLHAASSASAGVVATWVMSGPDVKLWNGQGAATGTLSLALPDAGPRVRVTSVNVTADGRRVLALYSDGVLRVWSLADAKVVTTFPAERLLAVTSSPDGRWVAVSGSAMVLLWKLP